MVRPTRRPGLFEELHIKHDQGVGAARACQPSRGKFAASWALLDAGKMSGIGREAQKGFTGLYIYEADGARLGQVKEFCF
jgi:hypothetical protein